MAGSGEVTAPARRESGAMTDPAAIPAPALAETLAVAFEDDPVFRWGIPDDDEALGAIVEVAAECSDRLFAILERMAEQHPREPHWYLFFLGTRPERQAQGLGSALIRRVLDVCDAEGTPAYLEATSQRSVALYGRHGFDVVGEIRLPGGPSLWADVARERLSA
jgi:GNAT superfamily N-acetyltransferase